jgi:predicted ATPase/class 3 adenylate cyclase
LSISIIPTQRRIPTGTVTFLFTDIEGSTALAQAYPVEMPVLLEKHHAILSQSIEAHHGYVFRITGDAFAAAFPTSADALLAALDAQRKLAQEAWQPVPVKVRMGIHTGAAQADALKVLGDVYEGYLTLTRVQRIMSAAHGGQVLLSSTSVELVRGQLPEEVTLRDLGEHRLKGLVNPERLWQLVVPGLPAEFPPLQSLNAISNNLPAQPTALIGREVELGEVVKRLSSEGVRLLTLTGPGGIGKTRMALQAAAELIEQFKDGVYFIDLAPIRDPESFPTLIAQTLGLRETSQLPLLDEIKVKLQAKTMLLLLDNFEQVTAAASQVAELIRDCPNLKLLVTSREALHVRGEYVFPVPPLAMPRVDQKQPPVEQLTQFAAVRLFIERAQAVKPDFEVTNENAPAVAEICWRLDGLPMAIELAAARIRLFSPQALLERLGSRLKLLQGGARDLPVRQQTLRDAIDWSYELLDGGEQRLFELLSVFSGGCSIETVEGVASGIVSPAELNVDTLDGLASLVDKSLVRQVDQPHGEYRLLMLETIREYALERLEMNPALHAAAHRAHAVYFAEFTRRQWERLTGHERDAALEELGSDIENARAAWRYWVGEKDLEQLGKFVDSLWLLYDVRGWYRATVDLTTDLLNVLSSIPSTPELAQQEIVLRTSLARALLATKGYTAEVEAAYNRALELSQAAGVHAQLYPVLRGLYSFYTFRGEMEKGLPIGEQILELAERSGDANMRIEGHFVLGTSLAFTGNVPLGLEHLDKGIALIDPTRRRSGRFRLGNYPGIPCYTSSALILWGLGFPDQALQRAYAAVELAKKVNHPYSLAYALFHTCVLQQWRRETELSLASAQAVLEVAEKHEFQIWKAVGTCLEGVGFAGMGRAKEGLAQIQKGMDSYQELKSPPIFWPLLRSLQAEVCSLAGSPEQGLALLDEIIGIPNQGYGSLLFVDTYQLKGTLMLAHSPDKPSEAEYWFLHALQIAQEQGATMLELRVAISLTRLWRQTGKADQGRRLLSETYAKFTEGFTTPDLIEARELLGNVSTGQGERGSRLLISDSDL